LKDFLETVASMTSRQDLAESVREKFFVWGLLKCGTLK